VSPTALFTVGALVTLITAAAMALLVYAAILDGRDAAARKAAMSAPPPPRAVNILETAQAAGSFDTLVTAVERAGLRDVLEQGGPYTVFAPSDEAFAKLPAGAVESLLAAPDTLADVVNYHLVPGRMTAADIARRLAAETLQGEDLAISNNGRSPYRRRPPRLRRHRSVERGHPCHRSRAAAGTPLKGAPR
jgi:uncharacterized surface protein with fasciclin (FAS1) repeats